MTSRIMHGAKGDVSENFYQEFMNTIEGFRNPKLGIAISVTTVFIVATSELEK